MQLCELFLIYYFLILFLDRGVKKNRERRLVELQIVTSKLKNPEFIEHYESNYKYRVDSFLRING